MTMATFDAPTGQGQAPPAPPPSGAMPAPIATDQVVADGADLRQVLAEFAQRMERNLDARFIAADVFEGRVRQLIESAQSGAGFADMKAQLSKIESAWDMMCNEFNALKSQATRRDLRESDDLPRLTAASNPAFGNLLVDDIPSHMMAAMIRKPGEEGSAYAVDAINAAVNEGGIDRNMIERYGDFLERKGLSNRVTKAAVNIGLGRMPGNLVEDGHNAAGAVNNELLHGVNASLTSASGSGGAIIPTLWGMSLWTQMNAVAENFVPEFMQVPMTGARLELPMLTDAVWDIAKAQAEAVNVENADWGTATLQLAARNLELRTFISQDVIDDAAIAIDAEFQNTITPVMTRGMLRAILRADTNASATNNVNPVAYTAPTAGNARSPEDIGFNGFFAYAVNEPAAQLNVNEALSSTNTEDHMEDLRRLLGWGGQEPTNAIYICGLRERQDIRKFAETYKTLDNVGAIATALTGDIRRLGGMRIYTPRVFPDGFLATGRIGTSGNDFGAILAVARDLIRIGIRRLPQMMVYPTANLSARGIYPGAHMRFAVGVKGRNPENRSVIPNILLSNERALALMRNIHRS